MLEWIDGRTNVAGLNNLGLLHPYIFGNISGGNRNLRENSYKPQQKNCLNSPKKITHVDDMMIHNLIKYRV